MAYYSGLQAKWPDAPPGTVRQRLDWINATMIQGAAITPATVAGSQIYDLTDAAEFSVLTASQQASVDRITAMPRVSIASGTRSRRELNAIFTAAGSPVTHQALLNLYASFDAPQVLWWPAPQAIGGGELVTPVNANDLANAGLS